MRYFSAGRAADHSPNSVRICRKNKPLNAWHDGVTLLEPMATHLAPSRKAHDNVCEKMGSRDAIDLYNLRDTFATRSILWGTDVTILQKILGHSEIGMTMRYVKIAEHYKVQAAVRLEQYRAVKMQEAMEKMQQEAEKPGMSQ